MPLYSKQTAVSDGTLGSLLISFEFFDRDEIHVYADGIENGVTWAWGAGNQLVFSPVVPSGVTILVQRVTDLSKIRHAFSLGAAFTAPVLDEDLKQVLHIAQEATERDFGPAQGVRDDLASTAPGKGTDMIAYDRDGTPVNLSTALDEVRANTATAVTTANAARAAVGTGVPAALAAGTGASLVGINDTTLDQYAKLRLFRLCNSYAEIRALDKTKYTRATALARTTLGDGGYGEYYCDLADTTSSDNGYSVLVATDGGRWKLLNAAIQCETTATDYATRRIDRITSHAGGTVGFVNSALRLNSTVGAGVTNYEWTLTSTMDNYAPVGEQVAVYGQAIKRSTGGTWAGCLEIRDMSTNDPANGSTIGLELTCTANGGDNALQRNGVHVAMRKSRPDGTTCEWGNGFRASGSTDARFVNAFYNEGNFRTAAFNNAGDGSAFAGSATLRDTGKASYGVDLSGGTYWAAAIKLASGQSIMLDEASNTRIYRDGGNVVIEGSPVVFTGGRARFIHGTAIPSAGNTARTATAGIHGALPAQVAGYEIFHIDGVPYKRPYYEN